MWSPPTSSIFRLDYSIRIYFDLLSAESKLGYNYGGGIEKKNRQCCHKIALPWSFDHQKTGYFIYLFAYKLVAKNLKVTLLKD